MVAEIVLYLLVATAPGDAARIVAAPLAADPFLTRAHLHRPHPTHRFAAPTPPPDLRRPLTAQALPTLTIAARPKKSFGASGKPTKVGMKIAALVSAPPDYSLTARPLRGSAMAAGVTMRMTNVDGVLVPRLQLAGAGGNAATRILAETMGAE